MYAQAVVAAQSACKVVPENFAWHGVLMVFVTQGASQLTTSVMDIFGTHL